MFRKAAIGTIPTIARSLGLVGVVLLLGQGLAAQEKPRQMRAGALSPRTTHRTPGRVLLLDVENFDADSGLNNLASHFIAAGKTPVIVQPDIWLLMTTADFAAYDALALPDPSCYPADDIAIAAAKANASTWGAAVDGNVIIIGTDENAHRFEGGNDLMAVATDFVLADAGKTGMYISLSCYYNIAPPNYPLTWLDDAFGGTWEAAGTQLVECSVYDDAHIVATHPALTGLTDATLSNWGCSVHNGFDDWSINFEVLVIAEDGPGATFTAPDGTFGYPYILARGVEVISDITLSPDAATNPVGTDRTVTATVVTDDPVFGTPVVGTTVTFTVIAGPHMGTTDTDVTNAGGQAFFTYTGTLVGIDTIEAAFVDADGKTQRSNRVTKKWIGMSCFVLNFERDDSGLTMVHGTKVDSEYDGGATYPVTITSAVNDTDHNTAAILESNFGPAAQDPDLLVGSGNILIMQTDANEAECPSSGSGVYCSHNDDEDGGTVFFTFNEASSPTSIDLIDIDAADPVSLVVLTNAGGAARTYTVPAGWTGDGGQRTLDLTTLDPQPGLGSTATATQNAGFDPGAVLHLDVNLGGSGAIDNLIWCP